MRRKDVSKFIIPEVYGDALSYEEQVLQMKSDVNELKENTNELSEKVEGIGGDVEDVKADIDILQYNDSLQDTKIEAIENDYLSKQNGGTVHGGVLLDNLRAGDEDNGGDLLVSTNGSMTFIKHRDGNGNEGGMTIANIGEDNKPFLQISSDGGVQVTNLDTPTSDDEATNKKYVDSAISTNNSEVVTPAINAVSEVANNALPKSGGTMTGNIDFGSGLSLKPPTDSTVFNGIEVIGNVRLNTGVLYMNGKNVSDVATPTSNNDAANKKYVDDNTQNKVTQVSSANKIYATANDGSQTSLTYGTGSTQYAIVERTTGGNIILPTITSSSNDNYAATKKYVDDSVTASVAGVASIGGATGAITLAEGLMVASNALKLQAEAIPASTTEFALAIVGTHHIPDSVRRYGNLIVFNGNMNADQFTTTASDNVIQPYGFSVSDIKFGVVICNGEIGIVNNSGYIAFANNCQGNYFGFILI